MEQIGKDIYFDLVDHDKVRSFRIQKQIPFNLFKVQSLGFSCFRTNLVFLSAFDDVFISEYAFSLSLYVCLFEDTCIFVCSLERKGLSLFNFPILGTGLVGWRLIISASYSVPTPALVLLLS